jgi:peroxiredoxin Q/BCP
MASTKAKSGVTKTGAKANVAKAGAKASVSKAGAKASAKAAVGKAAKADVGKAGGGLRPGSKAPAFRLPSDAGTDVSLADYAGRWVVVYFYPRDSTPGCTREAIAFRDAAKQLAKRGAVVLGISRDSIASHCRFRDAQKLTFPLLSDPDASVHGAYGAYGEKTMYGKKIVGALRTTVLVRPDGTVGRVFPSVKVDGHADAVIAAIDELSGGG